MRRLSKISGGLFSIFRRASGGTTSVNGVPDEPDSEPPLRRYAISKPRASRPNIYGVVPLSARSDIGSLDSQQSQRNAAHKSTITLDTLGLPADTTETTTSRAKVEPFPRSSPRTSKPMPPLPVPTSPPRIADFTLPGPIKAFTDTSSIDSGRNPSPRPENSFEPLRPTKSRRHPLQPVGNLSPVQIIERTVDSPVDSPVTSIANLPTAPFRRRKEVPGRKEVPSRKENQRKIDVKDLKVSIPDLDKVEQPESKPGSTGRLFSDDALKNDLDLLTLSREVGKGNSVLNSPASASGNSFSAIQITDFAAPPRSIKKPLPYRVNSKKRDKRRSKDIPQPRTPPRIPLPAPPRKKSLSSSRLPRLAGPPIRKKIPSKLKQRLSKDLESARNSDHSNEEQVYTEVLELLSDVLADAAEDDVDISRHIKSIQQSLTDPTVSEKDVKKELKQLSKAARQSKHASRAMLNIYSALSTLPTEAALSLIEEVFENPTRAPSQKSRHTTRNRSSKESRRNRGSSESQHSTSKMFSEFDSELGRKLNEKLAKYEDPNSVIVYDNLLVPKMERSNSGSSMRILQNLDSEVDLRLWASGQSRKSADSSTRSSIQFDDNIRVAEKASASPLWMPSPKVWRRTENTETPKIPSPVEDVVQPKIPGPAFSVSDYLADDDILSPTVSGLSSSPGPRGWLALSFDDEPPLTSLKFEAEPSKVEVRKAMPVRSAPNQDIKVLSKQAGLWRPIPPPQSTTQSRGLWNAPQETGKVVRRHRLLDFSSGPDSPMKPRFPVTAEESQTTEYESSGLWKLCSPVESPAPAPLWRRSQQAGADGSVNLHNRLSELASDGNMVTKEGEDQPDASENEAKLWTQPHPHRSASIAASTKGLWRNDTRVTIRYQRTHRQWPYVGSVRYPRQGRPSDYRAQSFVEDRDGLWRRPDPEDKVTPQMWMNRRRSEFIPRDSELPSVSLKDGNFLDEVNFILESRFSSPTV